MRETDVIIPVYKPTKKLLQLLEMLEKQTIPVNKIILINTEQKYFDHFILGTGFWQKHKSVVVEHISKREFDHGKTRNFGVSKSNSPFFVMMTDDAVPEDEQMLEKLLAPFSDEGVAMTYARQLPAEDCRILERYTRSFNYPSEPQVKGAKDLPEMGIKAFFASNVCAAYRKDVFQKLHGFVSHTIFNEDMIYARRLIDAGCQIAYAADARVYHSHNYNGAEQFRRNFDLGVSHAQYPHIFGDVKTESEGIRLVKTTAKYLFSIKKPYLVLQLIWFSGCKYIGYFLGKRYRRLPAGLIKKCSMNQTFWI